MWEIPTVLFRFGGGAVREEVCVPRRRRRRPFGVLWMHTPLLSVMTRGEPEWSWRRWLMLGIYGLTAILNFAMWLTYACVSEAEIAFDHSSLYLVNLLGVVCGFGYLVGAPPAGLVLRSKGGLRTGMLWAAAFNAVAGILRWLGGRLHLYWLALGGQLAVGLSQPFFMSAPAQLAMECFPPRERATATSLGILSQVAGQALIFVVAALAPSLQVLVQAQAACGLGLLVLTAGSFRPTALARMSSATSSAAAVSSTACASACTLSVERPAPEAAEPPPHRQAPTLLLASPSPAGPERLIRDGPFVSLAACSAVCIGTYWTFTLVVGELLWPLGYGAEEVGGIGFVFLVAGAIGLLVVGPLMTRTHAYRTLMLGCVWTSAAASLALALVTAPGHFWPVAAVCAVLGFCLTAIQAVALEAAVEVTHPIAEAVSGGIILAIAVAIYCSLPFVVSAVLVEHGVQPILWGQCALLAIVSVLLTLTFRPTYRRLAAERRGVADATDVASAPEILLCAT